MRGFTGTWALARLALRRERTIAPIWIAVMLLIAFGMAANYARTFPSEDVRESFAQEMLRNSVLMAFAGQVVGSNLGALTVWRIGDTVYTLVALMAVFTTIRHSRADEESGRYELIGGAAIGRYALFAASLMVACGLSAATGLLTALGLATLGFEFVGAVAFGLAIAAIGCTFAA
ncbi:MAG TPA: ABC transporter permease, partial [Chloroflexota bacterium]|nr:ABC transporter permease [Chloroflexota bacterium]